MLYATSTSFATIWSIQKEEKYCVVKLSTSRKDKRTDKYVNSNWSYVKFVGEANQKARNLNEKDKITNIKLAFDNEPYEKDGQKVYPKFPHITFFDFDTVDDGRKPKGKPIIEEGEDNEPDDGDLPF